MEAIAELAAALLEGLFVALFGLFEIAAMVLVACLQLVFVLMTRGTDAAREQWLDSRKDVREKWKNRKHQTGRENGDDQNNPEKGNDTAVGNRLPESTQAFVGCGLIILLIVVIGGSLEISRRINKQRTEEAEELVRDRVEEIKASWGDPPPHVDPTEGQLMERDPWGNRLELFVDEALLGVMLTVRSAGADGKTGTIDDVISVRVKPAKATDVGRDLGNRAADKLQSEWDGFKQRFGAKSEEMRQKIIDISNEQSGNGDASTPEDQPPE